MMASVDFSSITVEDLRIKEYLTARSINCCLNEDLITLKDIIGYFLKRGSFLGLRNCGQKTDAELTDLCNKYLELYYPDQTIPLNYKLEKLFNTHKLSSRAFHCCYNANITDTNGLIEYITKHGSFLSIHRCGALVNDELSLIVRKLLNKTYDSTGLLQQNAPDQNITDKTGHTDIDPALIRIAKDLLLNAKVNLFPNISEINILYNEKKVPVLKIIETHFYNSLNPLKKDIFQNTIQNRLTTLQKLGDKYSLTRERIRQIRHRLFEKVFSDSLPVILAELFEGHIDQRFIFTGDFVHYSADHMDDLYKESSLQFSFPIFTKLLALINPGYESINHRTGDNIQLKDHYFLNKGFDAGIIIEWISFLFSRRDKNMVLSEQRVLLGFLPGYKSDSADSSVYWELIKQISVSECNAEVKNNSLYLPRNTKKKLFEYIYDALAENQKPMHLSEILTKISSINPSLFKNEQSIRSAIYGKPIFCCIGRESLYGLSEWEITRTDFKGGTIRQIIIDYLKTQAKPMPVAEIIKHVFLFRKTNRESIMGNLRIMGSKSPFVFYSSGCIGLKTYE